jgi:hypothetical protein
MEPRRIKEKFPKLLEAGGATRTRIWIPLTALAIC